MKVPDDLRDIQRILADFSVSDKGLCLAVVGGCSRHSAVSIRPTVGVTDHSPQDQPRQPPKRRFLPDLPLFHFLKNGLVAGEPLPLASREPQISLLMSDPSQFLLYAAPDGTVKVDVLFQEETVWLTQKALAELFGVKVPAVVPELRS